MVLAAADRADLSFSCSLCLTPRPLLPLACCNVGNLTCTQCCLITPKLLKSGAAARSAADLQLEAIIQLQLSISVQPQRQLKFVCHAGS